MVGMAVGLRMVMAGTVAVGMRMQALVLRVDMIRIADSLSKLSAYQNINFRGRNALAINATDTQFSADIEDSNGSVQQVLTDSCVKKCANRHVSTNAREALDVSDSHILIPLSSCDNLNSGAINSVYFPDLVDRQYNVHGT